MQPHSITARYLNHLRAKKETVANGKAPAHRSHGHKLNVQVMEHESEHPKEVAHYLTDYRNDNMQLARRVMGRQEAFNLNLRLKNTGFAWAVKTGY